MIISQVSLGPLVPTPIEYTSYVWESVDKLWMKKWEGLSQGECSDQNASMTPMRGKKEERVSCAEQFWDSLSQVVGSPWAKVTP